METERMDGEQMARLVQGSLLNKVYAMHHDRERETALMSQLTRLKVSPSHHLTSSDKLLLSSPPHKLGVATCQGLSAQLACLSTAMSDMSVEQQDMEVPACTQYMLERSVLEGTSCDPHSQAMKRQDPVYLSSMASHDCDGQQQVLPQQFALQQQQLVFQQQQLELQHQQQQLELQHQQQLELQQRSCNSQILAEQLGGFVLPNRKPDLIPLMDSMQLE